MAVETPTVDTVKSVLEKDRAGGRPGSVKANNRGGDRELRLDASRRMTGAAILGLLLLSMSVPFAVYKLHRTQRQQPFDVLATHEQEAAGGHQQHQQHQQQDPVAFGAPDATLMDVADGTKLPVTPNLLDTFLSLKHTSDHGLLLTVRGAEWDSVREEFMAALDRVAEMPPSVFEGTYMNEETLRLLLAMDLVCLENAAVEAKLAIDDTRAGHGGGYTEEMALRFQRNMQIRRQQAKAVDLWEAAVVNDQLGSDPALKDSLMRLLLAVRSRAASSEYLTAASAEVLFSSEPSARAHAEENRIYEGLAFLIKAGQLAASDNLIKAHVAPWLAIIFTSF
ncbi:hypothetical protein, conserved [Eimeria praecox]|uniref:Transmembrane protein n=1 Tax=Eimeria praecox TaxID=51316 RepID=U6G9I7_9EIME|nr:hypothetical protein, conserved [Eimeria praecox]